MDPANRTKSISIVVLVGIIYILAGVVFGPLSAGASSHQGVVGWRLAAWIVSAVAFAAQILYEQIRLNNPPRSSAYHAALAAAIGAFGLAISALIHRHGAGSHTNYLAFIVWPVLVFIPAFLVAWIFAALITRARRSA
jgi:hypothetical protein